MKITVLRDLPQPTYTSGRLSVEGVFQCFTLEPKIGDYGDDCAIRPGTYPVQIRWSPHFRMMIAHIDGVPGRSAIEIHDGNTVHDTDGCLLVGQERIVGGLLKSDLARQALQSKIAQAQATLEPVHVCIQETVMA